MHFGKIADMLWLSQVFENVNLADTLERYQRFCRTPIHVIFADSSKGVCPVICLQYLKT